MVFGGRFLDMAIAVRAPKPKCSLPNHLSQAVDTLRFPNEKILEDEIPVAGDQWAAANAARNFRISRLGPGFDSDEFVQRVAIWATE